MCLLWGAQDVTSDVGLGELLLFSALSDLTVGLVKNLVHLQEAFLALITRMGADRCILSWYFNVFTLWWVVFQHFEAQILR